MNPTLERIQNYLTELSTARTFNHERKKVYMAILLIVNLLNYMDRYTVASVLTDLQQYFHISDSQAGLLQTVFIWFYMLFAPICGYLGDRFNRKLIMSVGLSIWTLAVFLSSLASPDDYTWFLICRGIVGIGEASYSTVAPTMIADMFTGSQRSWMLMVFYIAIPGGSGLGFMLGSRVSALTGHWQWGVRVTPLLAVICLLLIYFVLQEPHRGESENANFEKTSLMEDIKYLIKIPTYIYITIGFTAIVFVTGSMSWWTPTIAEHAYGMHHGTTKIPEDAKANISLIFGVITCSAGLLGVFLGAFLAESWRDGNRWIHPNPSADPLICSLGALIAVPCMYLALILTSKFMIGGWFMIFLAVTSMCFNWAINMDILMYTIIPNRRALATAIQTLISHLFGDATSPYIVGLISDLIRRGDESSAGRFFSLQYALFLPNFVLILGVLFYMIASFSVVEDREKNTRAIQMNASLFSDDENSVDEHAMEQDVRPLINSD